VFPKFDTRFAVRAMFVRTLTRAALDGDKILSWASETIWKKIPDRSWFVS
jgi:hypothetical protein